MVDAATRFSSFSAAYDRVRPPNPPRRTRAARLPARRAADAPYQVSGLLSSPAATLNPFARQIVVIKQLFAAMLGERAEIG